MGSKGQYFALAHDNGSELPWEWEWVGSQRYTF